MTISRDRRALATVVGVALLTCAFGFANAFAHDDAALIVQDTRLHDLTQLKALFTEPYWPPPFARDQYRPVTSLLLTLQYIAGSGEPIAFRLASALLYAGACVALFRLALLLLPFGAAFTCALLFAAHPLHVEATALGVSQAELLVSITVVAAVVVYMRERMEGRGLTLRQWSIIGLLYAIAMLSKEQGFLLPGFLLLSELILVSGASLRSRVRLLWRGYAVLAALAIVGVVARFLVLGEQALQPNIAEALVGKTLAGRAVTMFRIFPDWMRLFAWPAHLRMDYSPRELVASSAVGAREMFGFALFVAVAVTGVALRRRAPVAAFGLAWTALALLPVSNVFIPTGVLIAERTLFLPSVGFVMAVTAVAAHVVAVAPAARTRQAWQIAAIVAGLLVVLGVARAGARQREWRDNDALTLSAIRDSPRSWRAQANYGEYLFDRGRVAEGRLAFERAIALAPRPWWTRNAYARRLRAIGDDSTALAQLWTSIGEFPTQVEAVPDLVAAMIALGRYAEARAVAQRVILRSGAPAIMVRLRQLADSAEAAKAPSGTVRVTIPSAIAPTLRR